MATTLTFEVDIESDVTESELAFLAGYGARTLEAELATALDPGIRIGELRAEFDA